MVLWTQSAWVASSWAGSLQNESDQIKSDTAYYPKDRNSITPIGYNSEEISLILYPLRYNINLEKGAQEVLVMNKIAQFIRESRKAAGLTQEEFAARSGLGLRFVRELEQGKPTVRMDKVNTALGMFGMEAVPGRKDADRWRHSEPVMSM